MKDPTFVSAVIYVRDNEDCILNQVSNIGGFMELHFESFEIILVNDGSADETLRLLRTNAPCNLTVVNLSRRHGVEIAMIAGLEKSMGDFVYEIDLLPVDFPEDVLTDLFKHAKEGHDIVAASPGTKMSMRSRLFYTVINRFSYLELDLSTERMRIVSRRALNSMLRLREKTRYRKALYSLTGYQRITLSYTPLNTPLFRNGRENISLAMDVVVSFSNVGLRLSHYLSFAFVLTSLCGTGYGLFNYFFNHDVVPGWTTLVVLISLGFSGTFFILGMMGEYVSRILIEVQNRPLYSVSNVDFLRPCHHVIQRTDAVAATVED